MSLFFFLFVLFGLLLFFRRLKEIHFITSSLTWDERSFAEKVKVMWTWMYREILKLRLGGGGGGGWYHALSNLRTGE